MHKESPDYLVVGGRGKKRGNEKTERRVFPLSTEKKKKKTREAAASAVRAES